MEVVVVRAGGRGALGFACLVADPPEDTVHTLFTISTLIFVCVVVLMRGGGVGLDGWSWLFGLGVVVGMVYGRELCKGLVGLFMCGVGCLLGVISFGGSFSFSVPYSSSLALVGIFWAVKAFRVFGGSGPR
jgi:hypothetical protein